MDNFRDKVAVITGGASGIGLAIARALVAEGAKVVVADVNADASRAAAEALGDAARACRCDVTKRDDIVALADAAWAAFGRVDLLFNNAGVMPGIAPLTDASENDLRWVYEVNVFGAWNVCQVFVERLTAQGTPAHIVNTGSENSLCALGPMMAVYNSSKHAVLGFTDILRHELPDFIGISLLCPGVVKTNLSSSVELRPEQFGGPQDNQLGSMAVGMEPEELAERCLAGVRRGDFFIVTHYATRYMAEERCQEIMQAFDEQTEEYDGWREWDSRSMIMRALAALQGSG
ncbi:MAG: SDR family oxidoreductase [Halieaceae bacterium]|jgi:NAD(P)-dependent dehydrogenase (short-subunit alcohol dehydrogenase family)|nr:SDR family oxidoreductase [Halieaceae bacterium]